VIFVTLGHIFSRVPKKIVQIPTKTLRAGFTPATNLQRVELPATVELHRELVMTSTLELQFLAPTDWRLLRSARLEALMDSPRAFTSSYARESEWDEEQWRQSFHAATWIVSSHANKVIGVMCSVAEPERPGIRHLESIWVASSHRRTGVFRALLRAVAQQEYPAGVTDLLLWVLEHNHSAWRAYETVGFEFTGERQYLRSTGQFECRLRLSIRPSRPNLNPIFQVQEVHGRASTAYVVDTI
jgi:ribosomal protein S18 acetylase RimI-like enzyme